MRGTRRTKMATRPHLSVLIVNFDKTSHTAQCLYICFENALFASKADITNSKYRHIGIISTKQCISSGYIYAIVV